MCLCDSSFQCYSWCSTAVLPRLRQTKRILRPLVLGTLFRAHSFRTRGVRNTERVPRVFIFKEFPKISRYVTDKNRKKRATYLLRLALNAPENSHACTRIPSYSS